MTHHSNQQRRGFTLIELLVVIAIIGTLASVVLASLNSARVKARDAKRLADTEEVVKALQLHWVNNGGTYPTSASDGACGGSGQCLGSVGSLVTDGYLPSLPSDDTQSGTQFNYRYVTCNGNRSYGLRIHPEGSSDWCAIKHQANFAGAGTGGAANCWMAANGVPEHGWCDDEI